MHKYDLTVLVKKTEGIEEKLEALVKALGGKSGRMTEMGKKQLAYPIQKVSEAHYLSWGLEIPGDGVVQLEKKLTNDRDLLRHLLVRIDK
jgi:small subunit ribosomal protein S6